MSRRLGLLLLAFGAVAVLVSAASAGPRSQSRAGGTLRLMWAQEPDSLDPALANGYVGSWVLLHATCAKLFTTVRDPDTGKTRVAREVVRRFTRSDGGRTYTFELKPTFRFHTGARVTAESFAAAINRNADPRMHSPVSPWGLHEIVGADAVVQGKAKTISGVQVLGHYRLRIRLKRRTGDFVHRLTMPYFCPILPGTLPTAIDKPPGSGPYYLAHHVPNRRIVLNRNPHYRGGRTANPDRIVWTIEPDQITKLRETEADRNDYTQLFALPDTVVADLVDTYGLDRPGGQLLRLFSTFSNFLFVFNPDRPALTGAGRAGLRKAVNYALDRRALTRAHTQLTVRPSDRLLPAALSKSRPLYPLGGPDLVRAREWLERAGRPPPRLTLYTWNIPFGVATAQVFAASLKPLGIEVDFRYFGDFGTLVEQLHARRKQWDVLWLPMQAAHTDPAGVLLPLLRGTRYEAAINAANGVPGAAARAKAWADLEANLMLNDPPVAAYADATSLSFVSRNFGCWIAPGPAALDLGAVCRK